MEQKVRAQLGRHGVRYTRGRQQILAALIKADGPRSALEIHQETRGKLPLSSVYRSLAVLTQAGVLTAHHGTKGLTRYEPAEWLIGHHHHLVCVDCGAVSDVQLPADLEDTVEEVVTRIAHSGDFVLTGHTLEVEGRCRACA